jgi:hypothetical protein
MNAIGHWISQVRGRLAGITGRGTPPRKYRVTPRHNACAFRRALLCEAIAQLQRMPLNRPVPEAPEESGWQ